MSGFSNCFSDKECFLRPQVIGSKVWGIQKYTFFILWVLEKRRGRIPIPHFQSVCFQVGLRLEAQTILLLPRSDQHLRIYWQTASYQIPRNPPPINYSCLQGCTFVKVRDDSPFTLPEAQRNTYFCGNYAQERTQLPEWEWGRACSLGPVS